MTTSNILVRKAMLQDAPAFRELWHRFMIQQHEQGSLQIPNDYNLGIYCAMFTSYVLGNVPGLALLALDGPKHIGVHLEGEVVGGFELSIGRYTMMWGAYLEPDYRGKGISHQIHQAAMEWTYKQGYEGGITGVLVGDRSIAEVVKQTIDKVSPTRPITVELAMQFKEPS